MISRIIASAMAGGVVMFWAVTWIITEGGSKVATDAGFTAQQVFYFWAALALSAGGLALFFRGKAVQVAEARGGAAQVQKNLIISWALLEGPALLAGVIVFVLGSTQALFAAIPIYFVSFALTFPRAEWFAE